MRKNLLTKEDVKIIAKLSKITLTEKEITKFQKQLTKILAYFHKLQEVDTSKIETASQTTGLFNVFRKDQKDNKRVLSQKSALSNAKKTNQGYFLVPGIFDEE